MYAHASSCVGGHMPREYWLKPFTVRWPVCDGEPQSGTRNTKAVETLTLTGGCGLEKRTQVRHTSKRQNALMSCVLAYWATHNGPGRAQKMGGDALYTWDCGGARGARALSMPNSRNKKVPKEDVETRRWLLGRRVSVVQYRTVKKMPPPRRLAYAGFHSLSPSRRWFDNGQTCFYAAKGNLHLEAG